jgi:uncharacterized membrane protein
MNETLAAGLIVGGAMFAAGLLMMWLGNRMTDGRFRRNRWAGIRTPSTMKSDTAWFAAHEVGGPWMSGAGLLAAVGGLTGILAAALGGSEAWVLGLVLAGAAGMTVLLITGTVKGARAARRVE